MLNYNRSLMDKILMRRQQIHEQFNAEKESTLDKFYIGNTEGTYYYFVSSDGEKDFKIVDQEGQSVFTLESTEKMSIAEFLISAIKELSIVEIAREVLLDHIIPMFEEQLAEKEGTPEDLFGGEGDKAPAMDTGGEKPKLSDIMKAAKEGASEDEEPPMDIEDKEEPEEKSEEELEEEPEDKKKKKMGESVVNEDHLESMADRKQFVLDFIEKAKDSDVVTFFANYANAKDAKSAREMLKLMLNSHKDEKSITDMYHAVESYIATNESVKEATEVKDDLETETEPVTEPGTDAPPIEEPVRRKSPIIPEPGKNPKPKGVERDLEFFKSKRLNSNR